MNRHKCVLVVEDDPEVRDAVRLILQDEGFEVHTAANGAEALRQVCQDTPDAIVLDLSMPIMSGTDFLRAWREQREWRPVPVLLMSTSREQLRRSDLAVQAFVPKPFDVDVLVREVEALLG